MMNILRGLLFVALAGGWVMAADLPGQDPLVNIGILGFQDESGTHAPPEFLQKLGQDLRLKLSLEHKDVLGRPLSGEGAGTDIEQLAALGRQQGVRFVIRGGLLAAVSEKAAGELRCRLEIYCDLIAVDDQTVSTYRASGEATENGSARDSALRWDSYAWGVPEFAASALGRALDAALGDLAEQVYIGATSAAPTIEPAQEVPSPVETEENLPADDAYQTDQELQQLIAQAESLITNEGASGLVDVAPLQQTLESLLASLSEKLGLLEQALDTSAVDQRIMAQKEELQGLVDACAEQLASASAEGEYAEAPAGGQSELTAKLRELLEATLDRLLGIQEVESALGTEEEVPPEDYPTDDPSAGDEYYAEEEPTSDVGGIVVGEAGEPIEGATVVEPETGASGVTDSRGAYLIPDVPGGRVMDLQVVQAGRTIAAGKVDVKPGRTGIADWVIRPGGRRPAASASRVLPPTAVAGKAVGRSKGNIRGVVLGAAGRPLSLVLVTVPGVGVVRTDPAGRYFFANVPPGSYELIVRREKSGAQTQRITVAAAKTTEQKIVYRTHGAKPGSASRRPVLVRGAGTSIRGRVVDEKGLPLGRAKLTLLYRGTALAVYSDERGAYEFRNFEQGSYRIQASKRGYKDSSTKIDLSKKKQASQDFCLKPVSSKSVRRAVASKSQKRIASRAAATAPAKTVSRAPMTAAAAKAGLQGTVVDAKSGIPVAGASVVIRGKPGVKTDSSGRFRFTGLAAGAASLTVKKAGYKDATASFTASTDATASVRIRLVPLPAAKTAPAVIRKAGQPKP